jgi:hypothetical protein
VDLLGDTPHRFTVLAFTVGYHFVAGRVTQALGLTSQLYQLATRIGDPLLLTVARQNCNAIHCYHGDFPLTIDHAEAALATLNVERERFIGRTLGLSSCVGILGHEYIAFWMLGFPERARRTNQRCVALAMELGHTPSIGFALTARTACCYLQGDANLTLASADEALRVTREERLGYWDPMITVFRGWAVSELTKPQNGLWAIRDAIERYRAAGNGALQVWMNVMLAGVLWKAGHWNESFSTLAETMTLARENGEGLFEPELYRLEGAFRFEQAIGAAGPSKATSSGDRVAALALAERRIRESLDRARRQEARMLELRSLVILCRLQKELGTAPPDYEELAGTYKTFTEGFDTPDLREARSTLETSGVL